MKVRTFKPETYRGCPVYYRNLGTHWEYLVIWQKEIYTAHIRVRPTPINVVLYWFNIEYTLFSQQQNMAIISQLRRLAKTTIDFLNKEPNSYGNVKPFVPHAN